MACKRGINYFLMPTENENKIKRKKKKKSRKIEV
jgi:hypothetical protein